MMAATVLIPTHDHGPTLVRALASALEQSVRDIEIFVVGDGVPDVTRTIMAEAVARDARVRFFDNPKGPRHGEAHRHSALAEARGVIVCYLSDDDLWFPEHVETMLRVLERADFAGALPVRVDPDGRLGGPAQDLSLPETKALMLAGHNRVPLSCGAHTLAMYRRLPHGWRPAPDGAHSDLHMWQQFLADPDCLAVSSTRPTVIHLPTLYYQHWRTPEALAVLDRWLARIRDEAWRRDFVYDVLDFTARFRAQAEFHGPQT
jgi:glycosyltransferase involved in cell wall biosynthesis